MKKAVIFAIVFAVVFTAVYFVMSFLIPGLRIKLEAEPAVLFAESLKSMFLFKAIVGVCAGGAAGAVSLLIMRRKNSR